MANTGSADAEKAQLRREMRRRRRAVDPRSAVEAAQQAAGALVQSQLFRRSAHIALYSASDGELDPLPIAERALALGRRVYLPRIRGAELEFADWRRGDCLSMNRYGIGEPRGPARALQGFDLLLLPLVAWCPDGTRLGMGGGFYDRSLARLRPGQRPALIGVAYDRQCCETLPREAWDVPLDGILTESGLRFLGASEERR